MEVSIVFDTADVCVYSMQHDAYYLKNQTIW